MSLHHGLATLAREFRSLLDSDDGQAIPEYALITGLFGFGAVGALLVVAATSATQLTGTQSRVTNASITLPAP